uniref:Ig-like domain-containing protein n=1 Tax=Globodera pallida TaxID=36090 RepID=A0A183CTM9_GLOPA
MPAAREKATSNGNDQLPIKSARFVHVHPLPLKHHQARLNPDGNRAFLDFGLVPTSVIGKYRCEITTEEDKLVTGNLFVYMRPVLEANASMRFDRPEEANAFAWVGPSNKMAAGESATVRCPVVGYPKPTLSWSKDGTALNLSVIVHDDDGRPQLKYLLDGVNLHIRRVCEKDEGIY